MKNHFTSVVCSVDKRPHFLNFYDAKIRKLYEIHNKIVSLHI
jgi:hypothetical protein